MILIYCSFLFSSMTSVFIKSFLLLLNANTKEASKDVLSASRKVVLASNLNIIALLSINTLIFTSLSVVMLVSITSHFLVGIP